MNLRVTNMKKQLLNFSLIIIFFFSQLTASCVSVNLGTKKSKLKTKNCSVDIIPHSAIIKLVMPIDIVVMDKYLGGYKIIILK